MSGIGGTKRFIVYMIDNPKALRGKGKRLSIRATNMAKAKQIARDAYPALTLTSCHKIGSR